MTTAQPATIKLVDMSKHMEEFAVACAKEALDAYNTEKEVASFIKKEFDRKYGPTWHCFVGRNFGSFVTHEEKHYIYFYLGQVGVMVFKSG